MSTLAKSNCHFFLVGKIQDELEQFAKKSMFPIRSPLGNPRKVVVRVIVITDMIINDVFNF